MFFFMKTAAIHQNMRFCIISFLLLFNIAFTSAQTYTFDMYETSGGDYTITIDINESLLSLESEKIPIFKYHYIGYDFDKETGIVGLLFESNDSVIMRPVHSEHYFIMRKDAIFCSSSNALKEFFLKPKNKDVYSASYNALFIALSEKWEKQWTDSSKDLDSDKEYFRGRCYYYGMGVKQNKELGQWLLQKSAFRGHERAIEELRKNHIESLDHNKFRIYQPGRVIGTAATSVSYDDEEVEVKNEKELINLQAVCDVINSKKNVGAVVILKIAAKNENIGFKRAQLLKQLLTAKGIKNKIISHFEGQNFDPDGIWSLNNRIVVEIDDFLEPIQ